MASTYLSKVSATNDQKKLTISVWVKINKVQEQMIVNNYNNGSYWASLYFGSDGTLRFDDNRSGYVLKVRSTEKYNDTNAWYHIVANYDCSLSTPTAKLFVNGSEVNYLTQTIYSQNATTSWGLDYNFDIGKGTDLGGNNFDGIMSEFFYIQGYTHDASTFGETDSTTGEWKPKTGVTGLSYDGTGGNSCYLKFENSSNMDLDSGSNNISLTTTGTLSQTQDNPSNNFSTLNWNANKNANQTFTNGNTTHTSSTSWCGAVSSLGAYAGKYYAEFKIVDRMNYSFGVCQSNGDTFENLSTANNNLMGKYADAWGFAGNDGTTNNKRTNNTNTSYGEVFSDGDIAMIAMDVTGGKIYFGRNGTWFDSSNPATGASPAFTGLTFTESMHFASGMENANGQWNFGNGYFGTTAISSEGTNASGIGKFEYDVPSGYTALSTKGLNE